MAGDDPVHDTTAGGLVRISVFSFLGAETRHLTFADVTRSIRTSVKDAKIVGRAISLNELNGCLKPSSLEDFAHQSFCLYVEHT